MHQFVPHEVHVGLRMTEKPLVALAEIVQPWFAFARAFETVAGALAVAGEQVAAAPAVWRRRRPSGAGRASAP